MHLLSSMYWAQSIKLIVRLFLTLSPCSFLPHQTRCDPTGDCVQTRAGPVREGDPAATGLLPSTPRRRETGHPRAEGRGHGEPHFLSQREHFALHRVRGHGVRTLYALLPQ